MSSHQVWGCILCVIGAGFSLSAVGAWFDYQDTIAVMEQMDQMTKQLLGNSRNPFSAAADDSMNELLGNYRNRIITFFGLGITAAVGGTLLLKKRMSS